MTTIRIRMYGNNNKIKNPIYRVFLGSVTVTVCRNCSTSRRRIVPGTLKILSKNRWQSVTSSSRIMHRNRLANAEISSHSRISVL